MLYRWEKSNDTNQTKYYVVAVETDIFGENLLMCYWGRVNSKIGGSKCIAHGNDEQLSTFIPQIHRRRLQHGYQLVDGIMPLNFNMDVANETKKKDDNFKIKKSKQGKNRQVKAAPKENFIQRNLFD